ncbi:Broad specificity phosphatase PhoE [Paraburkholderia fungorum]|uniref:Broad specificity phosphatase PhoE n=1 Tax=Paraburkholderia fungorum TaxID=134537 RepID=A0A1H1H3I8_9BURK|nr:histidine phosphatase family protein [Paraburkholderia fungorum]SDR20000.1 Broad specificity phosphatase PhoE [Paraburkholderia fungorum]
MDLRLLLVSHASTAAQRAGRFPIDDDALDARSIGETEAVRARMAFSGDAAAFVSPAVCARETASALGLAATVDEALADINYGRWRGQRLIDIANEAPQELAAWTRDPDAAPPGGESFAALVKRVGAWLDALNPTTADHASNHPRHVVAVTHAPLLRAAIVHALGASPEIFARIEIAPLSLVELRRSSRGWTWRPSAS